LLFVKLADDAVRVVQLEHTKVGKKLALFNILEFSATDRGIKVVILHHSTRVRVWGRLPRAVSGFSFDGTVWNLDGKRDSVGTDSTRKVVRVLCGQAFVCSFDKACSLVTFTGERYVQLIVALTLVGAGCACWHGCIEGPRPYTLLALLGASLLVWLVVFDDIGVLWTDTVFDVVSERLRVRTGHALCLILACCRLRRRTLFTRREELILLVCRKFVTRWAFTAELCNKEESKRSVSCPSCFWREGWI